MPIPPITGTHSTSTPVVATQPPPWHKSSKKGKEKVIETSKSSSGDIAGQKPDDEVADEQLVSHADEDSEQEYPSPDSDAEEVADSESQNGSAPRRRSRLTLDAPPAPSRNPRTSEEERIAVLKADPFVNYFDPQNVQCKHCGKVIKLYGKNYYLKGWNNHREGCIKPDMDPESLPSVPPPTLPILPKKRLQAKKGPPENRIKELKNDKQVDSFDDTHITCGFCGRKIGMNTNYNLGAWKAHKSSCKGMQLHVLNNPNKVTDPSGTVRSRTSEHERIHELENDLTVLAFGPDYVLCKLCQQSIKLSGPYYLTTWHRHKYSCREKHSATNDAALNIPLTLVNKQKYGTSFDFEFGSHKVRRSLGSGVRPLSAIVATTGLYDWSMMPSYAGNTCPEDSMEEDKDKESISNTGGTLKVTSPVMPPSFKTSTEIAHAMNIAFAKAGLLNQTQQSGTSSGAGGYLGAMQSHAAESVRSAGSHPSGRYPPASYHTSFMNAAASGSRTIEQRRAHALSLISGTASKHNLGKGLLGEMVEVTKAVPSKRQASASATDSSSISEPKTKRPRKSNLNADLSSTTGGTKSSGTMSRMKTSANSDLREWPATPEASNKSDGVSVLTKGRPRDVPVHPISRSASPKPDPGICKTQ